MDAICFWLFIIALPLWFGSWADPNLRHISSELRAIREALERRNA